MAGKLETLSDDELRLREIEVLSRLAELIAQERSHREAGIAPSQAPLELSLARLPLTEAIIAYLQTCDEPQTCKQIWTALESAGRTSESETPVVSVRHMLRRMLATHDDLSHAGWSRWGLKSRTKRKRKSAPQNGTGGRSHAEHSERTRAGIELRRALGGRIGAEPKVDPAKRQRIKEMLLRAGPDKMSIAEIAKENGVGTSTIHYLFPGGRKGLRAGALVANSGQSTSQIDSVAGTLFDAPKPAHVRLVK